MTTVVVSDRRTTQVQLAVGDTFVLTADASISANLAVGVLGAGGNSLTIDGDILARGNAGVLLGNGSSNVSISGTGAAIGDIGIRANGPTTVQNAGDLVGLASYGAVFFAGQNVLSNSGFIFGAISGVGAVAGGNDFTNTGFVQGGTSGISISNSNNLIRNFGTIVGGTFGSGIELSGATSVTNTIINWGTITGESQGIFAVSTNNFLSD
jgi:hypothetical protein